MAHRHTTKTEEILRALSSTSYACSSLQPLTGGLANFLFRGDLAEPLADGTSQVAVKHGESHVALRPDIDLPTARCRIEVECLKAVGGFVHASGSFVVRSPRLYHFDPDANIQVQEYLANALSLKEFALKHFSPSPDASRKRPCSELGWSLGVWLRKFHNWAALPEQSGLRKMVESNKTMQHLKHWVNYKILLETVDNFPSILSGAKETFEQLEAMASGELQRSDLRVIHGDFWTGNVLLSDHPLREGGEQTPVFIVDWESCQLGLPELDVAQMIAELYQLSLFKDMDEGKWLVESFMAGYGYVDDDFAFRTALHVGTHLICWGSRVPGWGSDTQVQQVVATGKEVILRAWQRDRSWFVGGDLACLFGG